MELSSSSEINRCQATQHIFRILWKCMVHCPVHKITLLVHIQSQINPVYTPHLVLSVQF